MILDNFAMTLLKLFVSVCKIASAKVLSFNQYYVLVFFEKTFKTINCSVLSLQQVNTQIRLIIKTKILTIKMFKVC